MFVLDCPDAAGLARFYAELLGWRREADEDGVWVDVLPPEEGAGYAIACQQIENYRAPTWPEGAVPQQVHLDFSVDSIEEAGAIAEAAGAVKHPDQPDDADGFTVFLDPAGHPFCLCLSDG